MIVRSSSGALCLALRALNVALYWTIQLGYRGNVQAQSTNNIFCQGTPRTSLVANSGIIQSRYSNYANCSWTITVPQNMVVLLTFATLYLEYEPYCRKDKLSLYDSEGGLIDDLCWTLGKWRHVVTSGMNSINLKLTANEEEVGEGFSARWSSVDYASILCSGERILRDESGLITASVGYINYVNNADCSWKIEAGSNEVIDLHFELIQIQYHPTCDYDAIEVYDGPSHVSSRRLAILCGPRSNVSITSSSSSMYIRFTSDASITWQGFRASYVIRRLTTTVETTRASSAVTEIIRDSVCDSPNFYESLTSESGRLMTSQILPRTTWHLCRWYIRIPPKKVVVLHFDILSLGGVQSSCLGSFVRAWEFGASWGLLNKICPNTLPPDLASRNPYFVLELASNSPSVIPVISARWQTESYDSVFCSGKKVIISDSGSFGSSVMNTTYSNQANCSWLLIAGKQNRVQLTITSLEIEFHSRCIYDALYIYDGPSNRHNVLRIMCGSSKQVRVTSSASYMYVSFITNENNVDRGFEASFVGVDRVHTTPTSTLSTIWNVTPTPPRGPSVDDHNTCGVRYERKDLLNIVGGHRAVDYAWPWQVSLVNSHGNHTCGGTIIASNWVLTAAHCLGAFGRKPFKVLSGTTNVNPTSGILTDVHRIYKHPNYGQRGYDHDIALIRLVNHLNYGLAIRAVCLPKALPRAGEICYVTGFGHDEPNQAGKMVYLREATVPIVSRNECLNSYGEMLSSTMMCAGYRDGGADACIGDSGGPLVCDSGSEGEWEIHGITSWGAGCGQPRQYGVYTNVRRVLDWIRFITGL